MYTTRFLGHNVGFCVGDSDICIDGKHLYPTLERYEIVGCVCCEHVSAVRPRHVDGCYLVAVVIVFSQQALHLI